jgi:hypothetical protein
VGAVILSQIPDANTSPTVAADDLALVGVDYYIVDRMAVRVAALNSARTSLPDLDCTILGTCYHPFSLTVECDTGDIAGVAIKGKERVWVRGFDIVELDCMVTGSCEEALVGRDAETVNLGVGVLDGSRADA